MVPMMFEPLKFDCILKGNKKYTVSRFENQLVCYLFRQNVFMVIFVKRLSLKITKVILSQSWIMELWALI